MRIYVAGPWVDRHDAELIALELEKHGHIITHPWWKFECEDPKIASSFKMECVKNDYDGVKSAQALVVLNTTLSEGKATEQGLAIAWRKPIVCITPGDRSKMTNIFHLWGNYSHVSSTEDAIRELEIISKRPPAHSILTDPDNFVMDPKFWKDYQRHASGIDDIE